jgi:cobalt-zinc-cadmium efflux system membrane fusion protein
MLTLPSDSPKLAQIRVEPVQTLELPVAEVITPGKLEVDPNRVSRVLLPVTGRITSVMARVGDPVESGKILLMIDSPDADAAQSIYLQAEASLTQTKAALVKAQADYDRTADLFEHKAVAQKEVQNAEQALATARAAVDQAVAAREQASRKLDLLGLSAGTFGQKVAVRAPMSGKVLEMSVAPGEYRNDTNAPLITIADLSTLWVVSDVPESDIRFIQAGEPVEISMPAFPGERFDGRVTRIADTIDAQTRTAKVHVELRNPGGRFRPEMFARIRHIEALQTVPVVPRGAVIQGDGGSMVLVEQTRGRFLRTAVQVGRPSGDLVPILHGLKGGELVVVDGGMLLKSW